MDDDTHYYELNLMRCNVFTKYTCMYMYVHVHVYTILTTHNILHLGICI